MIFFSIFITKTLIVTHFFFNIVKISNFNRKYYIFKGALSGLTQFLASETPLKIMKVDFYFTLTALSVLRIFKFLS